MQMQEREDEKRRDLGGAGFSSSSAYLATLKYLSFSSPKNKPPDQLPEVDMVEQ